MVEPEVRRNVPGRVPYNWKPADGLNDAEELEYWGLAICVFNDVLLDEKVDSPVFDSWELDHVLLIDVGTNKLDNWLPEELAVGKFPDHDVLCEIVPESTVLERLDESWVEVEPSVLEDPPEPSNATLGSAPMRQVSIKRLL